MNVWIKRKFVIFKIISKDFQVGLVSTTLSVDYQWILIGNFINLFF